MKSFKLLSILVIVAFLLTACGGTAAPKELKLAVLAPLSGPVPTFGEMTRDGALLAIEDGMPRVEF